VTYITRNNRLLGDVSPIFSSTSHPNKLFNLVSDLEHKDISHVEELILAVMHGEKCLQIVKAFILEEMKRRWEARFINESYRQYFSSFDKFEDYAADIWNYSVSRCNELVRVGAALKQMMVEYVAAYPCDEFPMPTSVSQGLLLAKIPAEHRLTAWIDHSENGIPLPTVPVEATGRRKKDKGIITAGIADKPAAPISATDVDVPLVEHINLSVETLTHLRSYLDQLPLTEIAVAVAAAFPCKEFTVHVQSLIDLKPRAADLAGIDHHRKVQLAQTFRLAPEGYDNLTGQAFDDFLIEQLRLN
jgi:hypothetical protein